MCNLPHVQILKFVVQQLLSSEHAADKGPARRAGKTGCKLAVVQLLRTPGEQSHGSDRQHSEPRHPHVGRTDSIQNPNT